MQNQRKKFSLPVGVTYLNCAYMSPLMKSVEKEGMRGMKRKRNPLSISANEFFEDSEILRKEFATLINASDPKRVVVIPSVSYGLANVAHNVRLNSGDEIIVASEQFPSNYYPWHKLSLQSNCQLKAVTAPDTLHLRGKLWNERILEAIGPKTKIVAIGHVHWADGTRFDLELIRRRTREVGSLLIIDGSQSVGAMPFDMNRIQPDALICAGYKWLMGPYSIGLAYYGEYFDQGNPVEENWLNRMNSEDFAGLVNYQVKYQPGALRYEVGEHSNFILVPMMLEALRQVNQWQPSNIQEYCRKISPVKELRNAGLWIEDESFRGHHLFGIRFPHGTAMNEIKEKIRKKKISISFRGDFMRISPHVYNDARDFERLMEAIV